MKKRIFPIVIAMLLSLAIVLPVTASAANAGGSDVYWKKTVAVDGSKVTVTVSSVNGKNKLCGGKVSLTYDPEVLKFNPDGSSETVGTNFGLGVINTQSGKFIANFASAVPIKKDGVLAVAVFDLADGKVCNKDTFVIKEESLYDENADAFGKLSVPIEFSCNHKNKKENIAAEATCDAEGKKTVCCVSCGAVIKETAIKKLSHEWAEDKEKTVEPDCKSKTDGKIVEYCKNCKKERTTVVKWDDDSKSHDYGKVEVTEKPTEDTEGVGVSTCKKCGKTKTETIKKLSDKGGKDGGGKTESGSASEKAKTGKNAASSKKGSTTGILAFIIAAVVIAAFAVSAVIIRRKKLTNSRKS